MQNAANNDTGFTMDPDKAAFFHTFKDLVKQYSKDGSTLSVEELLQGFLLGNRLELTLL
jgi:hypothetical protein